MSRKKRNYSTIIKENDNIKSISVNIPVQPIIPGITLNEYLTNYSQNRGLDVVFQKWFMRQDRTNPRKQVSEWDELIQKFLNETV